MTSNAEFFVLQGNGFAIEVPFLYDNQDPINMRNYTVRCGIKRSYSDDMPTELVASQSDGDDEDHKVTLSLASAITSTLMVDKYYLNLDIREMGSDEWIPILSGILEVLPNANHMVETAPPT